MIPGDRRRLGFGSSASLAATVDRRLRLPEAISQKIFKLRSLSTIVLIGRSNRYRKQRKHRKMAKPEKTFKLGPVRAS
ncbi:MAG: hypothetical protein KC994_24265, partial [Candidatus Omnitrophica bacterium]|nr:hypothetical protein [Candidatus Omnitrophota bacterium]